MNLDQLFGEGVELDDDVVIKAQLRFRVHPPEHPAAQALVDRLVSSYDERLDMICEEVGDVLKHSDIRRSSRSHALVIGPPRDVVKAAASNQPIAPGTRGGKWYRDGTGHIRYGEKPMGAGAKPVGSEHVQPHVEHFRPSQFMGMHGIDRDLTGFLMTEGDKHGFKKNELRFLGNWYGTATKTGSLFDAFLDCAGITREDLAGDITQLRFGAQQLTYEEAVFEFFAAQRALFLGDESDDDNGESDDGDETWESMLNDEIRPLLDSTFKKYETLKEDPAFKEAFAHAPENIRRRFFARAHKCEDDTNRIATVVMSAWDPEAQVSAVVAGIAKLGLFTRADVAHLHDQPNVEGADVFDDALLTDDARSNPLLVDGGKLDKLTVSQLMLLHVAAEMHRRWDPDTRSYSTEAQADVGPGALGEATLNAIAERSPEWAAATKLLRAHLDTAIDRMVASLNRAHAEVDKLEVSGDE